jgi:hypothetical protein
LPTATSALTGTATVTSKSYDGSGETAAFTRAAFGIAPYSKLLYSSDGVGMPEFHWLSARQGRRIVGEVLGEIVAQGDLSIREAEAAGEDVLRRNALRLYRIGAS